MNLTGIKGVIFDLDGTLVESSLNFTRMRADIGCPQDEDILTFVDALSCDETKANAVSYTHLTLPTKRIV